MSGYEGIIAAAITAATAVGTTMFSASQQASAQRNAQKEAQDMNRATLPAGLTSANQQQGSQSQGANDLPGTNASPLLNQGQPQSSSLSQGLSLPNLATLALANRNGQQNGQQQTGGFNVGV